MAKVEIKLTEAQLTLLVAMSRDAILWEESRIDAGVCDITKGELTRTNKRIAAYKKLEQKFRKQLREVLNVS